MRWFNLNTGIIILVIIIILLAIGMGIVGFSLWNVPKAKELFSFLEISEAFPTKAIALFTGLATFGTLVLALTTILTIKNNNDREKRERKRHVLDKVVEFVIELQNVPIKTGLGTTKKELLLKEFKEIFEYAGLINKLIYMLELVKNEFKDKLETEFRNVAHDMTAYAYTNAKSKNVELFDDILGSAILSELKESLKDRPNSMDKLAVKYGDDFSKSCHEFFVKAAIIRASL